jgi:starch-binding outer membrane protein, SusD/RagB family
MKKNILKIIILICTTTFFSCNYLDQAPEAEGLTFEKVFGDSLNYTRYCDYLIMHPFYLQLENGIRPVGSHDCGISDNSISCATFSSTPSVLASIGDYYAMRTNSNSVWCNNSTWSQIWSHIRVANTGIRNISHYPGSEVSKNKILGMCYFYRAWAYSELCRRWGGMPYLYAPLEADAQMDLPRLSMQETYERSAIDCDSAAMYLQNIIPASEFPRPTRVAALALKSRVLLYAASDLARNETDEGKDLWEDAALAADACLRVAEANGYGLVEWENFYYILKETKEEYYLKEILLGRRQRHGWNTDAYNQNCGRPPGQLSGKYGSAPNANFVESFEMANGLPTNDPASGYNPQNPYVNRDSRFYFNIMYNGATIAGKTLQIYHQNEITGRSDALDLQFSSGVPIMGYTLTGTYVNKWMGNTYGGHMLVMWPYIRMAEIYLNFAEAANEAWGNPSTKDSRCLYAAEESVNKVRNRAQMPNINSKFLSKNLFRDRVRNERRVELSFEEHRVYDLRRWKIATQSEYRDIYGYHITKLESGTYDVDEYPTGYKYEKRLVQPRVFEEKHYLFVIKLDDTRIGPNFKQNPGW